MNTHSNEALAGGRTSDAKYNFGKKGWRLVIVALLAYTIYIGFDNVLNWVVPAFSEIFQTSQTSLMLYSTIGGWVSILGIVVFGGIQKKLGCKKVLMISLIIFIVAAFVWANATNIGMYAFGAILTKAMGTVFCMLTFAEIGSNWFPTKKGNYMGVITVGVVLGAFVSNGPVGTAIRNDGPKAGIMLLVILSIVVLILSIPFVKNFPEEAGANPDNDKDMTPEQAKAILETVKEYQRTSKWTVGVCLRHKTVWLAGLSFGLLLCVAQGLMAQTIPAIMSWGHSDAIAQIVSITVAPFALVATLLTGKLDQKWGTKKIAIVIFVIGILACVLGCAGGAGLPVLIVSFWLISSAVSGGNNLLMSFISTIWGRVDFSTPYMVALTISQIISATGFVVISGLASLAETYVFAFLGGICLIFIGLIFVLLMSDRFLGRTKEDIVNSSMKA